MDELSLETELVEKLAIEENATCNKVSLADKAEITLAPFEQSYQSNEPKMNGKRLAPRLPTIL